MRKTTMLAVGMVVGIGLAWSVFGPLRPENSQAGTDWPMMGTATADQFVWLSDRKMINLNQIAITRPYVANRVIIYWSTGTKDTLNGAETDSLRAHVTPVGPWADF